MPEKFRVTVSKDVWGDEREPKWLCLYSAVHTAESLATVLPMLANGLTPDAELTVTRMREVESRYGEE